MVADPTHRGKATTRGYPERPWRLTRVDAWTPPFLGGILAGMREQARSSRDDPLEKTGYRIPRSVVAMVREAVEAGEAKSQNEFVERALARELRAVRQRNLYEEYARATRDAAFTSDMDTVVDDFDPATLDGLREEES